MIPQDWSAIQVRDIGKIKNGINKPKEAFGSGTPFVNLMDVFGKSSIGTATALELLETTKTERNTYNLKAGDVLFIRSSVKPSGVGLTTLVKHDLPDTVFSGFLLRFRDSGNLDAAFKEHCFHAAYFRKSLIDSSTVSANTNINQSALGRLWLIVPPLHEQQAIAAALSDADGVVAGLERVIAKKRLIKQGAIQDLLTARRRLPGFSGEWKVKRLGELGQFFKGSGVRKDQARSGVLPCVRYGELYTVHHDVVRHFTSHISEEVAQTACKVQRGDVLFAGSGETKEEIGKCAAVDHDGPIYAGGDIVGFRPVNADGIFLSYLLNAPAAQKQKASRGQGDAVVHISASALSEIQISLPSGDEQRAISGVLEDMDAEIQTLKSRLTKARAVKEGMMQNLLTGRVRLV